MSPHGASQVDPEPAGICLQRRPGRARPSISMTSSSMAPGTWAPATRLPMAPSVEGQHGGRGVLDIDAGRVGGHAAHDPGHGEARDGRDHVQLVAGVHEHDTAAGLDRLGHARDSGPTAQADLPVVGRLVDERPDAYRAHPPDRAATHQLCGGDARPARSASRRTRRASGAIAPPGHPARRWRPRVKRDRLLDQHVAPGFQDPAGDGRQQVVRDRDIDRLHLVCRKQVLQGRVWPRPPVVRARSSARGDVAVVQARRHADPPSSRPPAPRPRPRRRSPRCPGPGLARHSSRTSTGTRPAARRDCS